MSENRCKGCGAATSIDTPIPSACDRCPERDCPDCGIRIIGASDRADGTGMCPCWTPVSEIAHADLKAALAIDGLGISLDGEITT